MKKIVFFFLSIIIFLGEQAQNGEGEYSIQNRNHVDTITRNRLKQYKIYLGEGEVERIGLKLSKSLLRNYSSSACLLVRLQNKNAIPSYLAGHIKYKRDNALVIIQRDRGLLKKLLLDDNVIFVQQFNAPLVETSIPNHDLSVNYIDWFKATFDFDGEGILVGLKERSADTLDVDLRKKFIHSSLADNQFNTHATAMATLIAGRGNSSLKGLGVANGASLVSSSFTNVLPDPNEFLQEIHVQNHSYGFDILNEYDVLAEAYDQAISTNQLTLHVFSAGNLGDRMPETGVYAGLGEFANLSGGIKQAKNTLVVGATNRLNEVVNRSSRGPTYDGRIKPELVAYGSEGTSEAAALVSGAATLLQNMFLSEHQRLAENYLLKSILISSATDVGIEGPDFASGFGSLNMFKASKAIEEAQFFTDAVSNNQIIEQDIAVPANAKSVRIGLSWNDPATSPGSQKALINDLDLEVEYDGQLHRPLVPYNTPDAALLLESAIERRDGINNNELIILNDLHGGEFKFRIKGFDVPNDSQSFAVSFSFEFEQSFEWLMPSEGVSLTLEEVFFLRFHSNISPSSTIYLRNNNSDWQPIGSLNDQQRLSFEQPGLYQLMVMNNGVEKVSPTILVHPRLQLTKLYECSDDLLFNWQNIGADGYELYGIDSNTFERTQLTVQNDTSIFLSRTNTTLEYGSISIQPSFGGLSGVQGQLYDFSSDGIGCYVKRFNSSVDANQVRLDLELTTGLNVESIRFIREQEGREKEIDAASVDRLNYIGETSELLNGYYRYKGLIKLENSELGVSEIETDVVEVPIILPENNVLFPNPLPSGEELFFLGAEDLSRIRLFSVDGAYSTVIYVTANEQFFELKGIASGFYLYQLISTEERIVQTGRLIIE